MLYIPTPVRVISNHDKLFLDSSDRIVPKILDAAGQVIGRGCADTRTQALIQLLPSSSVYKNLWISLGSNPECTHL